MLRLRAAVSDRVVVGFPGALDSELEMRVNYLLSVRIISFHRVPLWQQWRIPYKARDLVAPTKALSLFRFWSAIAGRVTITLEVNLTDERGKA